MTTTAPGGPHAADPPESPLLPEHRAAGAALTTFAGWVMPLRYGSELAEHRAVRQAAGLFDLSHMAQLEVSGPDGAAALDGAVVSVVSGLALGRARYTMLTRADGGILDDVIVYRLGQEDFFVVANAANRAVVLDALTGRSAGQQVHIVDRTSHRALIALQGPVAAGVLAPLTDLDLTTVRYYGIAAGHVAGVPALVARTGYTGEDGFELSVPAASARQVWRAVLEAGREAAVAPCGLACRDTLRLEAGMPLYGQELRADLTPYDAGLGRVVDLEHAFVGRDALAARAAQVDGRMLIGLRGSGRRAARAGNPVLLRERVVGSVTSGALSPTLGYPIAMAHVDNDAAEPGTQVTVDVRGSHQAMEIVALPFYRRPR